MDVFGGSRPLILDQQRIPSDLRVVVLAPHPDDFDAIGVTMRHLHRNGNCIDVAVMTRGVSGVSDGFAGASTSEDKTAIREAEQRASCTFFGLPPDRLTFLRLPDTRDGGSERPEDVAGVRAFLEGARPDLVFLPHGNDTNATHRRVNGLLRRLAAEADLHVLACLNRDPKTIEMRQDLYALFGPEDAAWKGELLRYHASQHQRNLVTRGHGIDEQVLKMNRRTALEAGRPAAWAEAFELEELGGTG